MICISMLFALNRRGLEILYAFANPLLLLLLKSMLLYIAAVFIMAVPCNKAAYHVSDRHGPLVQCF